MTDSIEADVNLNSARINFSDCVDMVEELMRNRYISPADRNGELAAIIDRANWGIVYLYRAKSEVES